MIDDKSVHRSARLDSRLGTAGVVMIDAAQLPSALRLLADHGTTAGYRSVALYDLGDRGASVAVADVSSGRVLGAADTVAFSGQVLDRIVLDHLVLEGILARPTDDATETEVLDFCRRVKESLSTAGSASTPGGGTLLITRSRFEELLDVPLRRSAELVRDVVATADREIDALVLTGGGARIPAVRRVLAEALCVPVVIPENAETFGLDVDVAEFEADSYDARAFDVDSDAPTQAFSYAEVEPVRYTAEVEEEMEFEPPEERIIEPRPSLVPAMVVVLVAAVVLAGATFWAYTGSSARDDSAPDTASTSDTVSSSPGPAERDSAAGGS